MIIFLFFILILLIYYDFFYSPTKLSAKKIRINGRNGLRIKSLVLQDVQHGIWATRGYDIYFSDNNGKTFIKKFRIPISMISVYYIGNSSLIRKLFNKNLLTEIKVLKSGTIIAFADGKIYRLGYNEKKFQVVGYLRYHGRNIGMGVFPEGIAVDANGNIYYGEYFNNPKRGNVKIFYSSDDGKTWNEFFNFAPKEIRHIHGLCYDKYTNSLWVTTGDYKNEVIVGYFQNSSSELNMVTRGIQNHCAISLLFTKNFVYWGSDTPFSNSYIYEYDRNSNTIKKKQELNSMAWYALNYNDNIMAISTAVVRNEETRSDRKSAIWLSDGGDAWTKSFEFNEKQNSRIQTQIRFPRGRQINDLIFSVFNTDEFNGDSFIFISSDIASNPDRVFSDRIKMN
jgi:hypothetical protein